MLTMIMQSFTMLQQNFEFRKVKWNVISIITNFTNNSVIIFLTALDFGSQEIRKFRRQYKWMGRQLNLQLGNKTLSKFIFPKITALFSSCFFNSFVYLLLSVQQTFYQKQTQSLFDFLTSKHLLCFFCVILATYSHQFLPNTVFNSC